MKRKIWAIVLAVILIIALAAVLLFGVPKTYFKEGGELKITAVWRSSGVGETNITDEVDIQFLEACLPLLQCSRVRVTFVPILMEDVSYEIDGTYNDQPFHILLGDINLIYEDAGKGGWKIVASEAWLELMDHLTFQ